MPPLPRILLPVGCESKAIKALPLADGARVLPYVDNLESLMAALRACPVFVAIIGPDWPQPDRVAAREMILDHAVAYAETSDLTPASLQAAITLALEQRALQVESGFLPQLLNLIPDLVYFKDRCGRFLAVNPPMVRHFGVNEPDELIGRSDFDFFAVEHAQKSFDDEQAVIRTECPLEAKLEKETRDDGLITWCVTWKAPLRDRTGRIIGTYGFSRDVSEMKMAETALATERHLLDALLTGMPDQVFIKDREGRFLFANHISASWKGVTSQELRGKMTEDFYPPAIAAAYVADDEAVMSSGMPVINREEMVRTADGRELWVLTTKLPYRNPQGEIIGLIGMSRNITLRKGFDEQFKAAQAEIVTLRATVARLEAQSK